MSNIFKNMKFLQLSNLLILNTDSLDIKENYMGNIHYCRIFLLVSCYRGAPPGRGKHLGPEMEEGALRHLLLYTWGLGGVLSAFMIQSNMSCVFLHYIVIILIADGLSRVK